MVQVLGIPTYPVSRPFPVIVGDGTPVSCGRMADLTVMIKGREYKESFGVFPTDELILGLPFQQRNFVDYNHRYSVVRLNIGNSNAQVHERVRTRHTVWKNKGSHPCKDSFRRFKSGLPEENVCQMINDSKKFFLRGDNEFVVKEAAIIPPKTERRLKVI